MCQSGVLRTPLREASVSKAITIGRIRPGVELAMPLTKKKAKRAAPLGVAGGFLFLVLGTAGAGTRWMLVPPNQWSP
jgi:hypothetical protein